MGITINQANEYSLIVFSGITSTRSQCSLCIWHSIASFIIMNCDIVAKVVAIYLYYIGVIHIIVVVVVFLVSFQMFFEAMSFCVGWRLFFLCTIHCSGTVDVSDVKPKEKNGTISNSCDWILDTVCFYH